MSKSFASWGVPLAPTMVGGLLVLGLYVPFAMAAWHDDVLFEGFSLYGCALGWGVMGGMALRAAAKRGIHWPAGMGACYLALYIVFGGLLVKVYFFSGSLILMALSSVVALAIIFIGQIFCSIFIVIAAPDHALDKTVLFAGLRQLLLWTVGAVLCFFFTREISALQSGVWMREVLLLAFLVVVGGLRLIFPLVDVFLPGGMVEQTAHVYRRCGAIVIVFLVGVRFYDLMATV